MKALRPVISPCMPWDKAGPAKPFRVLELCCAVKLWSRADNAVPRHRKAQNRLLFQDRRTERYACPVRRCVQHLNERNQESIDAGDQAKVPAKLSGAVSEISRR